MAKRGDAPAEAPPALAPGNKKGPLAAVAKHPHNKENMAKPSDAPAEAPPAQAPGRKKRMLMAAVVAVVTLALGGGWYFFAHKDPAHPAREKAKHEPAPIFTTMEPFVVNLAGDVQHYLQVGVDLRVYDNSVSDQVKQHLPEIRNGILLLLSSKTVEDLAGTDQKNYLRAQIREVVNKPLGIDTPAKAPPSKPEPNALSESEAPAAVAPTSGTPPSADGEATAKPDEPHAAESQAEEMQAGVLDVLLTSFVIQ